MILNALNKESNQRIVEDQIILLIIKLFNDSFLNNNELLFLMENISKLELEILKNYSMLKTKDNCDSFVKLTALLQITRNCTKECPECPLGSTSEDPFVNILSMQEITRAIDTAAKMGISRIVITGEEKYVPLGIEVTSIVEYSKSKYPEIEILLGVGRLANNIYSDLVKVGLDYYLHGYDVTLVCQSNNKDQCLQEIQDSFDVYHLNNLDYKVAGTITLNIPEQTNESIVEQLVFLEEIRPNICSIKFYDSDKLIPYNNYKKGTIEELEFFIAVINLLTNGISIPISNYLNCNTIEDFDKLYKTGSDSHLVSITPINHNEKCLVYKGAINTVTEQEQTLTYVRERLDKAGFKII